MDAVRLYTHHIQQMAIGHRDLTVRLSTILYRTLVCAIALSFLRVIFILQCQFLLNKALNQMLYSEILQNHSL